MSDEARFIGFITFEIWRSFGGPFGRAAKQAKAAYAEFLSDERVSFGHPGYSWDDGGAADIAREYVTRFGEVA